MIVLISGASSGLGRQMAIDYSKNNSVSKLILLGRSEDKMAQTISMLSPKSFEHYCFDISNQAELSKVMSHILQNNKIDIAIANAGVSAGTLAGSEGIKQINTLISTNINGVVGLITPVIEQMIKCKTSKAMGKICLISSVAGLVSLPSSPSYSASKSFVKVYGDSIRAELKKHNIQVSVICPGYIKTPMTAVNKFKMPLLMSVENASHKIIKAIETGTGFIAFPFIMFAVVKLLGILPYKMRDFILGKLPKKSSL